MSVKLTEKMLDKLTEKVYQRFIAESEESDLQNMCMSVLDFVEKKYRNGGTYDSVKKRVEELPRKYRRILAKTLYSGGHKAAYDILAAMGDEGYNTMVSNARNFIMNSGDGKMLTKFLSQFGWDFGALDFDVKKGLGLVLSKNDKAEKVLDLEKQILPYLSQKMTNYELSVSDHGNLKVLYIKSEDMPENPFMN